MRFSVLTLFPEMFSSFSQSGVFGRALRDGHLSLDFVYLRDFALDKRKNVDSRVSGMGDGMLIKPGISENALLSVLQEDSYVINLTLAGKVFSSNIAKEIATKKHVIFLSGRYAGFDDRFTQKYANLHLSLGDFVLSGGELPAMCIMDTVSRYIPNVLGNAVSSQQDSFEDGLLEAPQYTKPQYFNDQAIPEILLSGDHKKIEAFQRKEQIKVTARNRPDMIFKIWDSLSLEEKDLCEQIWKSGI